MAAEAPPVYVPPTEAPAFINPHTLGNYDSLHNEATGLFASHSLLDGASLRFARPVGNHLQVTHSLNLNGKDSNYHFSPTYIGSYHHTVPEQGGLPVILGDITPNGSMIAQVIHEFNSKIMGKFQAQSREGKWAGGQIEGFYTGSNWAGSIKLVNIDPFHDSGIVVFNYFQRVSKHLAMGGEMMYQYNEGVEQSSLSFALRHKTPTHIVGVTLSPIGVLQSSYFAAINHRTAVATQLDVDLRQGDSKFNIGFQYNFREAMFKGQISSKGEVMGFLEKNLMPGMKFCLSGLINHFTGDTKFGFSFNVGA